MAKKKLGAAAKAPKNAVDLAVQEQTGKQSSPERSTERISVSLTTEELHELQARSGTLMDPRGPGRRDLKVSKLARVAFYLLSEASDEDILAISADESKIEDLEARRGKRRA